jgi:predicted esterase
MAGSLSAQMEHLQHEGHDRHYLVYLPRHYDPEKTYWPLVQAKRRQNRFESKQSLIMKEEIDRAGFDAILIVPILGTTDSIPAFPSLGEGAFLKHVMKDARTKFRLHDKIFLTGYSGGAQFTHRFAFQNPGLVKAVAPSAPRSWTTPDGRYLEFGLESGQESMLDLIGESVTKPARLKAKSGAESIQFLVMCGKDDPRLETCREFAQILQEQGYQVETNWPKNVGHGAGPNAPKEEIRKFSTLPVEFFQRVATK